jgi:hypothetical protein
VLGAQEFWWVTCDLRKATPTEEPSVLASAAEAVREKIAEIKRNFFIDFKFIEKNVRLEIRQIPSPLNDVAVGSGNGC